MCTRKRWRMLRTGYIKLTAKVTARINFTDQCMCRSSRCTIWQLVAICFLARRLEKDARQKRLYLAYSEKRLNRLEADVKTKYDDPSVKTGNKIVERSTEMEFIPLDPVIDAKELDGDSDGVPANSELAEGIMLTDAQSIEQHLVARGKLYNAALAANPHDIDIWLDFVAFQEQTLRLHAKSKKISAAVKASIEEKQAAILNRALASNPQSRELHQVRLNMLLRDQANSGGADVDSIQRKLEELLSEDPTNGDLWLKLIQVRQQHFGNFSMQSVRDLYARILAVLRTESEDIAKRDPEATKSSSTVCGENLGTRNEDSITCSQELTERLLDFHLRMCVFDGKAGYVERSITQLQALIAFNFSHQSKAPEGEGTSTHLEMLKEFALQWDKEGSVGFGDGHLYATKSWYNDMEDECYLPLMESFEKYIQEECISSLDDVNPPERLATDEHKQSLLTASSAYQRKAILNEARENGNEVAGNSKANAVKSGISDGHDSVSTPDSKLVYSNLHGYRINVGNADDTKEYERILSELRGTESGQARQEQLLEKDSRKRAALMQTISQAEDQRANFDKIDKSDRFMSWLVREEAQSHLQWAPLRSNDPLHRDLIEQQPDRATLTEEIQPFLFPVPANYHWKLIVQLLKVCGVNCRGEYAGWSKELGDMLYADAAVDCELLVAPIIGVLNSTSSDSKKLFLSPCDRQLLLQSELLEDVAVTPDTIRDPTKVQFIRRIFEQALRACDSHDVQSGLKCLWIGFEAELVRTGESAGLSYARHLSQKLAQQTSEGDTDFDVLYAYAKLELKLGNDRQVRRICDTTVASLGISSSDSSSLSRLFHRFLFLRARLEMWPSQTNSNPTTKHVRSQEQLRKLRCIYVLWVAWQAHRGSKEVETLETLAKKHRKQIGKVLRDQLMLGPSFEQEIVSKYRAELAKALRHCKEHCKGNAASCSSGTNTFCWPGYCLHNLALLVNGYQGFGAACQEYEAVLDEMQQRSCPHYKWVWTCYLEFMQHHQASGYFPVIAPRKWRSAVGKAVELFPHRTLFLRLFVDAETGNTISQVLRNYFIRVEKRWRRHYDSPELVEWLFALLCELCRVERASMLLDDSHHTNDGGESRPSCCLLHRWSMNSTAVRRIRHVFESMVGRIRTKGNALCWRLYLRFEIAMGKVDAAKKVFHRGIAACPWSKQLYMDGIRVLRPYLSEDECLELLEFMEVKELHIRVDFEE